MALQWSLLNAQAEIERVRVEVRATQHSRRLPLEW